MALYGHYMIERRPLVLSLLLAALLAACGSLANGSGAASAPLASGSYVYHPTPVIWETVTIADGAVIGSSGAVYEWNCTGQQWTIGRIPATLGPTYLQFGDDRFAISDGVLDARWQRTAEPDPRRGAALVCSDPMPTTKAVLSADAARELIKRSVTDIAPVLIPTDLPDRVSAMVETKAASFSVTYIGERGVRATLRTVLANPAPVAAGGTQQRLAFRGDAGAFYQALDGSATTTRTLLWFEPASKPSALGPASCGCVPYALTADGLSEADFWKIAVSLQ